MADMTDDEVLSGRTLGEFTLLDRLDEGGCGAVYRAKQEGLARSAVVKVLHRRVPTSDDSLQRLVREAQLASRVDHPYAVHVYAFGVEDDGLLWIAMEFVDGVSLAQWLKTHGPMPIEVFLPFFERVTQVVQAAHERGIVHRDLKPANIMVIEDGSVLLPKLLDFGVAKLIDDISSQEPAVQPSERSDVGDLTPANCGIGSPGYMAPELWGDAATAGPAADIYALGVIAYETLTGRRPYRSDSVRGLWLAHCYGDVPPGPPTLRRALAKRPNDRHDSAIDLAAALRGEATQARRRARIRRVSLGVGLIVAVALYGAVQWRAWYEMRLAQQRTAAAEHEASATVLTAEIEQGRAALLHNDLAGARQHLGEAWRRGDHSRSTEFMIDRAEQPLRAELARLLATKGRMWWAGWSPDGQWIATTDDAGAQIWDATTYQLLEPLLHDDVVYAAVWTADGRLVTACGDGSVRIWDATRGRLVRELRLHGRKPRWSRVAVSLNGQRIAAVDTKGTILATWDAGTGAVLVELPLTGAGWPAIAFSADGHWLAATGGGAAAIIDTTTWRRVTDVAEQVRAIAWDPTRPRLVTGSVRGNATLWSVPGDGWQAFQLGEPVTAVTFAPDGSRMALGGEDGGEMVVDVDTGRIATQGNHLHAKIVSVAFSPDGRRLAAAGVSGELAIDGEVLGGPRQQLRSATFDTTGNRVLAASWDGTARIWDARSPYKQWSAGPQTHDCGLVGGVEPDSRYLVVACMGYPTRVWDTARDRLLAELPAMADSERVAYPVVSARGDRAAIARGLTAEVYELPGGRPLATARHSAPVTALAFDASDGLVSGDGAGVVVAGDESVAMEPSAGASIDAIAVLPDGRIATADASGHIRIAGRVIDAGIRARMLRPSPDGRRLLVVAYYSERAEPMVLVDERGAILRLEGPAAYTARWVSGRAILSAHADGAARLWSADGALRHTYTGGARFLADADLTPDGSMVVGGGGDGVLRFWDAETAKPLWVASAHRPYVMGLHFEGSDIVTRGIGGEVARWHIPVHDAASDRVKSLYPLPIQ